jgi:predicted histidine transporter YuiF (NhaC family)
VKIVLVFVAGMLTAMLLFYLANMRYLKQLRKKKKTEEQQHPERKLQETKVIVRSIMVTYYIAFILGCWVVIDKDFYQIGTLLTYVGTASAFAIGFYCWKSKAENLEKIKKDNPELPGTLSDFSSISSQ